MSIERNCAECIKRRLWCEGALGGRCAEGLHFWGMVRERRLGRGMSYSSMERVRLRPMAPRDLGSPPEKVLCRSTPGIVTEVTETTQFGETQNNEWSIYRMYIYIYNTLTFRLPFIFQAFQNLNVFFNKNVFN